ncbi:MAG TPA: type IV pilus twitching motility protein PilT [Candidatus Dojkabacteria bacterium]|nr:type IV pilus twitching motility protein PilT [Candidatus Dojkabacteria bacterium]HQF37029.1 type IV pilus twitching motility protein PilT [Candidatus Dojkabacteria bacterium]
MKQLLEIVVQKNASDLHIGANYPALIRIDGELQPVGTQIITPEIAKDLIFSILSEENKEVAEINKEVDIAYAYEDIARFRVNVYHSTGSMSAALRLIPNKIKTMEELNLPKIYQNFVNLKQGLILVTGPTGHGKSTTLAAILNEINKSKPLHIITIEDPVEYVYPVGKALVNQREMKQDTHSWDIALKSILREDPDVVLVGEMRDYETISAAITIAETGHLVFATLHTNSASQTIDRIIDVFPEHQQGQIRTQLAVVIEGIIAQRLVKLNGGGRRAVSEVMMGTAAVRNIIREGKTYQLDNVIRTSGDVGMISIERSLVDLVREGLISVEDAQLNAINPEEVLRLLK